MDETYEALLKPQRTEVARAAGIIALGNITSRALGLLREMVKSGLFGAGPHVDALNAALRVPTTLYDLLVGGMINSVLIPVLSDYTVLERRTELWHLLNVLVSIALMVTCGLVLLGELLALQVVLLLVEGLSLPYQALAASLLRLVLPAVIFLSLASILSGGLYALKRFTLPAFTAAVFNAGVVVVALALGYRWGVHSMAMGLLVGAVLQVTLQLPGLRDARLRFVLDFRHPALRRIVRLYLPILVGLVVDTLAVLLSYNLASRIGEGSISWMEYAATIIQFPLGLVVTAVSIAILPTLSQQASAEETGPFQATLSQGLRLVLALIIPATLGLYILAGPLVALIFEHGDFTPADTVATAEALRCALLGLLFAAVDQPLIFAFYARKDTLTPALVGAGTTLLYVLLALTPWWLGVLTLPLLVLVNSLKLTAHALAMLALTQRRLGGLGDHGLWSLVLRASLAASVMAAATWGAMRALAMAAPPDLLGELLVVGGAGSIGLAIYGVLALFLRIEEIQLIRAIVADGLNRLTGLGRQIIMPWTRDTNGQKARMTRMKDALGIEREVERVQPVCPERYDEAYFLGSCEGYTEFIASEGAHLSRRLSQAFEVAEVASGMQVLDVGCGRGEIVRHCAELGVRVYGVDYAPAALRMAQDAGNVYQANAKWLPFPSACFDRVLMFDIVEHLHPGELDQALAEARRVLRPNGRLIIHTAPNAWYDRYAYPLVRLVRTLTGQGMKYPRDPRAIIPDNLDVHVNEQSVTSLRRVLRRAGFHAQVWLDTPPQSRDEGRIFRVARHVLFNWPPFCWFFEREVFAVARVDIM